MTQRAHDLTELTRAAKVIREAADIAAGDTEHDRVCCWGTQRLAHQESVVETRIDADGHDDSAVVAVPISGNAAWHIGLWGPNAARAVADWLDHVAERHEPEALLPFDAHWLNKPPRCRKCTAVVSCSDLHHALAVADEILGTKHDELRACSSEREALAANSAMVR